MHKGILPREGLVADPIFKLIGRTVLNPSLLLPLILLARYTKKGQDLSILHPLAFSRLKNLFYLSVARALSRWYSDKVLNNWIGDKYDWTREIVVVTGGAGGIGGEVVKLFGERGIKVVVLDIQPMTFEARKLTQCPNVVAYLVLTIYSV
jgi:all-trans-retinol dehydrogenase (NAD+)